MTDRLPLRPVEQVLRLLGGHIISQAISTAVALGVFDRLAVEAMTADTLADQLDCRADMLKRLLTVIAGEGLLEQDFEDRFRTTNLGGELLSDRLGPLAAFMGSSFQWRPWSDLRRTVRTGESAFELAYGTDMYRWMETHPDDARQYDRSIDQFTTEQARALVEVHDFANVERVVDIGGGRGTMLIELLNRWPNLRATLFDVPHVVTSAKARFERAGLADRVEFVGGDFFDALPAGGDVYLVKHVLHNWDDPEAKRILVGCRDAMGDGGQLLIIEGILPPGAHNTTTRIMDLEMMVLFGRGRERTKLEFRRLLSAAGFRLDGYTAPLGHFARLLTARPR